MIKEKHLLSNLWEDYPEIIIKKEDVASSISVNDYLTSLFSSGSFYHYTFNFLDGEIVNFHENLLGIHGFEEAPKFLNDLIGLVHPDDLNFVMEAEAAILEKTKEIGLQNLLSIKSSYCFRMRVADGSYHLFHHQAINLGMDTENKLTTIINIHTDIQHITTQNNYIAAVGSIGGQNLHQINLSKNRMQECSPPIFTKREMQILPLVASGLSSVQIAERFFISVETVKVHRKNILKKTNCNNSSSLVRKCLEQSWL